MLDAQPDLSDASSNVSMNPPYRTYADLPLTNADAWLFTSAWEGMPTILIELAMWGVPIVASAVGGVPEIIRPDTGWPIPVAAPVDAYVDALREALANPEDAIRRAENLQAHAAEVYTPGTTTR